VIHFSYLYILIIAQIKVTSTNKISNVARRLFCNINCIGENNALKIKFKIKGNTTMKGIFFLKNFTNTVIKDIAINAYKKLQTGPNKYAGGAQSGLISVEYQFDVLFMY
jgi:hypothetical protein